MKINYALEGVGPNTLRLNIIVDGNRVHTKRFVRIEGEHAGSRESSEKFEKRVIQEAQQWADSYRELQEVADRNVLARRRGEATL